jgi:hypothetical protein
MSVKRSSFVNADADAPSEQPGGGEDFHKKSDEKILDQTPIGEPMAEKTGTDLPVYERDSYARRRSTIVATAEDLITTVIDLEDDPTQNPWTFRVFFIGKRHWTRLCNLLTVT